MPAVAFDAMGVLYTTRDDLANELIPFALEHGSSLTPEDIRRIYRRAMVGELTAAALWRELGISVDESVENTYLRRYALVPGMTDLLDELRGQGVVLGCISNDIAEWSRTRRGLFGLDARILHWTVSGELGVRKPDVRIYQAFLEKSGLRASEVIFVDDRPANVDAAAAAGFATLLVDFAGGTAVPTAVRSVSDLRAALGTALAASDRGGPAMRRASSGRAELPVGLRAAIDLLPAPVTELRPLRGATGPWLIRFGESAAVLRWNDPVRLARLGFDNGLALASVRWLHDLLRDLAMTGSANAPAPVAALQGTSIAVLDGVIWELLTYVPGRTMTWEDDPSDAGRALAEFHTASLSLPPRPQRPGALPFDACRPRHPQLPVDEIQRELADLGYVQVERAVIHGDATFANMVVTDDRRWGLIDLANAYLEPIVADIACALWRTGRTADDSVVYDPARVSEFVQGYGRVMPLTETDARAIVAYLQARGLQLQHRGELRGSTDDTVVRRLLSIRSDQPELALTLRRAVAGR